MNTKLPAVRDRTDLLQCLEMACRAEWARLYMLTSYVKDDSGALRYGVLTPQMAHRSGWTSNRVSYHLRAAEAAGLVLSWNARAGGSLRWWPVGLFGRIQQDATAAKRGAD